MAEKKILIDIEVKNTAAITAVANLQTEIKKLRKEQGDLDRSTEEGAKQFAIMGAQIKALSKEQQAHEKTIQNEIKAQNEQKDSIQALKAQLSLQTAEYNKLSHAQREMASGKALQASIKSTSDELKVLEGNLGNNTRKVGDYAGEIGGLMGKLSSMPGPLGKMASGISGAATAFKGLNAVNPMGWITILIGLISQLGSVFGRSEEMQNRMAKASAVFNSILGNMGDLLEKVVTAIIDTFSKPQETLKKFGEAVKENISNRIEGMLELIPALGKAIKLALDGEFKQAGKVATDALGKVGLGVTNITDKVDAMGQSLKNFNKEIADDQKKAAQAADQRAKADEIERKLIENRAKTDAKIAELRLKAREADKFTAEQRRNFILEAGKLEDNLAVKEKEVAQLRYNALKTINSLSNSTKEAKKEESMALAELSNIEARRDAAKRGMLREQFRIETELARDRRQLTDKEVEDEKKRIADQLKSDITALNKSLEAYKLNQEEMKLTKELTSTEMLEMDRELATKETETKLAVLEKRKKVEKDNAEEIEAEIENVKKSGANKLLAIDKQASDKRKAQELANAQERADIELMLAEGNIDAVALLKMQALEKERLAAIENAEKTGQDVNLINQKYAKLEQDLNAETAQKKLDAVMQWADMSGQALTGINEIANNIQQQELMEYEEGEMKKKESLDARLAAGQISQEQHAASVKAIEQNLDKERKKIALEQAKRQKALTILSIILDTAKAVMAALPNIPLSIAAGALGAIQLGVAVSAPLPKASRGKLLKGKSHAQGGIPIEAEGGEAIINKKSTQMFGGLLSEINQAGGGVAFSSGDGGYGMRTGGIGLTAQEVENAMLKAVGRIKVVATIDDIKKADSNYISISDGGSF
jgi:hypothetical protein